MNKTYLYNLPANNIQFSLYGKGGNEVVYTFKNGSITLNQPAYFMTSDPYFQLVLEGSNLFKEGTVSYDKETAKLVAAAQANNDEVESNSASSFVDESNLTPVGEVKSVTQAINYVLEQYEEVARTGAQACSIAAKHGVYFPNLKKK